MATLSLQSFAAWTQQQAAAVQASCRALLDLSVGSALRAILEANSSVALWFQWLLLRVLALTRAATSTGADLDSWCADFSLSRLPAVAASGTVTLGRLSTGQPATVPTGALVRTADGTLTFSIVAGGTIASGVATGDFAVVCTTAGAVGNAQAGTITLLASALPYVDTVTNALAFTNGIDAESDAAFRTRFANYINTRSRATVAAVGYAISTVRQGLSWTIQENQDPGGAYHPGNFVVTVDDGTGAPSSDLLTAVAASVESVRPIGSTYAVQAPTVVSATVTCTITAAPGYVKANMTAPIAAAVTAYINALPLGAALRYTRLAQVIYDAVPGVANVTSLLLNAGTVDLGGGAVQVVRTASVTVS